MNTSEDAGEAIAAGGFGCVFRPPISCNQPDGLDKKKYSKLLKENPYITKLLIKKYAEEEMAEVNKILPIVKTIPNYEKYFLLDDIFSCEDFGPLTSEDLKNFSKCNNLIKQGYSTANINSNLNTLGTIYIPDGGESVSSIMISLGEKMDSTEIKKSSQEFGILSWGLINLLKKAIVPMNIKGLVHLDLKGDNLLVNPESLKDIKIIDWGLAGIIDNENNVIDEIKNRPIQFNAPFSNILFSDKLSDLLDDSIDNLNKSNSLAPQLLKKNDIPYAAIPIITADILNRLIEHRGKGHVNFISNFFLKSLKKYDYLDKKNKHTIWGVTDNCFKNNTLYYNYFLKYISKVFEKYLYISTDGKLRFNGDLYFQEVYRYNCDIWGLLMAYQDFNNSMNKLNNLSLKISNILYKYLYSDTYAAERIPVDKLIEDLETLTLKIVPKPVSSSRKKKSSPIATKHPVSSPILSGLSSSARKSSKKHTSPSVRSSAKKHTSPSVRSSSKKHTSPSVRSSAKKSFKKPLSIIKTKPTKKKKLVLKIKSSRSPIKGHSAFSSPPIIMNTGNPKLVKSAKMVGRLKRSRKRCPKGWKSGLIKGIGLRCIKK